MGALQREYRAHLASWEPSRDDGYFTPESQEDIIRDALAKHELGLMEPRVALDDTGAVMGRCTLYGINYGSFQSCGIGGWVAPMQAGAGLAVAAFYELIAFAFGDLGLHRVEAATTTDNMRAQRLLERSGFERTGCAPEYAKVGGRWRDHILYQRLNPDWQERP